MNPPKAVLFDFDGTIADTFAVALAIFNRLSSEFSYRAVAPHEIPAARKMTARQAMEEFGISARTMPRLAARGLKLLHASMSEVGPFAEIPEVLRTLHKSPCELGILSSNSEANVRLFLNKHDLELFDFVRCSSRILGKAKELRRMLRDFGWSPEEVIYVGDECRDIEAAHKVGIRIVAVSWGFNATDALAKMEPHALVHSPAEILEHLDLPIDQPPFDSSPA